MSVIQQEKIDDYIDEKGPVTLKEEEGEWLVLADREQGLVLFRDDWGGAVRFLMAHGLPFSFNRACEKGESHDEP